MVRSLAMTLVGLALEPCVEPAGGGTSASSSGTGGTVTGSTTGNLYGTWNGSLNNGNGSTSQTQLVLAEDTSFSQQVANGGVVTTLSGTFTVPSAGTLSLSVQSATPADSCNGGVCTPISYPSSIVHTYTFPTADTLALTNKACETNCTVTYTRSVF